tara:strand:- start:2234 stop:2503 length:270 start_codon:yes stop_codon:yes gene_type:complete
MYLGEYFLGVDMEHLWMKNFDEHGVWTKDSRMIRVEIDGEMKTVDMDEYAASKGIQLPDKKFVVKKKDVKVHKDEDMGETHPEGDSEES